MLSQVLAALRLLEDSLQIPHFLSNLSGAEVATWCATQSFSQGRASGRLGPTCKRAGGPALPLAPATCLQFFLVPARLACKRAGLDNMSPMAARLRPQMYSDYLDVTYFWEHGDAS